MVQAHTLPHVLYSIQKKGLQSLMASQSLENFCSQVSHNERDGVDLCRTVFFQSGSVFEAVLEKNEGTVALFRQLFGVHGSELIPDKVVKLTSLGVALGQHVFEVVCFGRGWRGGGSFLAELVYELQAFIVERGRGR